MQQELSVAGATGTRGGGWGDRSFLRRNAGKMTTIEAKHENLSKETAKHHTCSEDAEHGGVWNLNLKFRDALIMYAVITVAMSSFYEQKDHER